MRLFAGRFVRRLNSSKPIVALMQSRRIAFPVSRSPARRHSTPSLSSSFRYFRSARRRARTVSLNARVRGMSLLLRLTLLVVGPSLLGRCTVAVLALLRPAAEQNHDRIAVLAEVDSMTRPEIDAVLEHAGAHALHVREVAQLQPANRNRHFRGRCGVERLKPACEGTRPCAVEVLKDRQPYMVSGGEMARTGLRMMPTSPSPSLKFRTAGFPQYGFKASLSGATCRPAP